MLYPSIHPSILGLIWSMNAPISPGGDSHRPLPLGGAEGDRERGDGRGREMEGEIEGGRESERDGGHVMREEMERDRHAQKK